MKILAGIVIMRRISTAAIGGLCLNFVEFRRLLGVSFKGIALEGGFETNEMLAKEVNIIEDWAVIKGVSGLVASSTRATGDKVIMCGQSIDMAAAQPFKMVET